jgi:hypothetical protein
VSDLVAAGKPSSGGGESGVTCDFGDTMDYMDSETAESLTITLDLTEAKFLLTILKASREILTTIMGFQQSMPGLSPPPITTEAIVNIAALAEKIGAQIPK